MEIIKINEQEVAMYCGIWANNREALLYGTDQQNIDYFYRFYTWCVLTIYLPIEMPCGEKIVYQKKEDVPSTSVPCSCGNPKHWFIKYGKEG